MPDHKYVFARVHYFFRLSAAARTWDIALVTLFKTIQTSQQSRTGMRLVREDSQSAFIEVGWIIRRVFICQDYGSVYDVLGDINEYWVNDLIGNDPDMYLRLQAIGPCL